MIPVRETGPESLNDHDHDPDSVQADITSIPLLRTGCELSYDHPFQYNRLRVLHVEI